MNLDLDLNVKILDLYTSAYQLLNFYCELNEALQFIL